MNSNNKSSRSKFGILLKILNLLYLVLPLYFLVELVLFYLPRAGFIGEKSNFFYMATGLFAVCAIFARTGAIYASIKNTTWKYYVVFSVFLLDIAVVTLDNSQIYNIYAFEYGLNPLILHAFGLIILPYDILGIPFLVLPGPLIMIIINAIYLKSASTDSKKHKSTT